MKGSLRLFKIWGINIDVHFTFLLLPLLFGFQYGLRGVFLVISVFLCVTLHELMHSLQAKRFGIKVDKIVLLPIGGVASMRKLPDKPSEELIVSLAGPLTNIIIGVVFFFPLYKILGPADFFHPSLDTWSQTFAYLFWINPMLAAFNLLPAFPMDGGRILRAFLAQKMDYQKATRIAVGFGHAFAILFAFWGVIHNNFFLIFIALFVYFAASQEGQQVDIKTTLSRFHVKDVLSKNFITVSPDNTIAEVLGMVLNMRQEDFPVLENGALVGFLPRNVILYTVHQHGMDRRVSEVMYRDFPAVGPEEVLSNLYNKLNKANLRAVPVVKDSELLGIVSLEDISRVYTLISTRG